MRKYQEGQMVIYKDCSDGQRESLGAQIIYVEPDSYLGILPYKIRTAEREEWANEDELTPIVVTKDRSNKIQRYDISPSMTHCCGVGCGDLSLDIEKCDTGEWVKWSDVEKLLK